MALSGVMKATKKTFLFSKIFTILQGLDYSAIMLGVAAFIASALVSYYLSVQRFVVRPDFNSVSYFITCFVL